MKTKIFLVLFLGFQLVNAQLQPIKINPTINTNFLKYINLPNGYHCFDLFEPNTTVNELSQKNAYLLMMCNNDLYPDIIEDYQGKSDCPPKQISAKQYNDTASFKAAFEKLYGIGGYGLTKFDYFSVRQLGTSIQGYVMSNDKIIILAFKGTELNETAALTVDVCAQCAPFIKAACPKCSVPDTKVPVPTDVVTDGTAFQVKVPANWGTMPGAETAAVHLGYYTAYNSAKAKIKSLIEAHDGGKGKKLWITGHSYGGGLATLAAIDLTVNGHKPQGVYTFANPRVGNRLFKELYNSKNINHIRFVNQNDIIPMLPGDDIVTTTATAVTAYGEVYGDKKDYAHVGRIFNLHSDGTIVSNDKEFKGIGDAARHSTLEYVYYIYYAYIKNLSNVSDFPDPVTPRSNEVPCTPVTIKAISAPSTANQTENLLWQAGSLISNLIGSAVPNGDYIVRCYSQRDHPNHGLSWVWADKNAGTKESQLTIDWIGHPGNNIFHIEHDIAAGAYKVSMLSGRKDFAGNYIRYFMEVPGTTSLNNNAPAQMQEFNVLYPGQNWLFYQIPNQTNMYVIKNVVGGLTGKVLDADDGCFTNGNCGVKQYAPINNDQTQIWILEKQ